MNGIVEVAGPEQFRLDELAREGLSARQDPREVVADPGARYFGAILGAGTLVPAEGARLGDIRFQEWLGQPAQRALILGSRHRQWPLTPWRSSD